MAKEQKDGFDTLTGLLGLVLGYALFAGFLVLYQNMALGHFDSNDFFIRLITPFSLRFWWTDLVCYGLIVLSVAGLAKLWHQL